MADPLAGTVPTAAPNPLPPDLEAQIAQLLRDRQMSQMFMQQGMQGLNQPTQYTPGAYSRAIRTSPLSTLANAMQGYMGMQGVTKADTQIGQIGVQNEQQRQQEMSDLQKLPIQDAIAKAMISPRPATRAWGDTQRKIAEERAQAAAKLQGEGGDVAGGVRTASTGIPPAAGYSPPPVTQPEWTQVNDPNNPGKFIGGWKITNPKTGEVSIHTAQGQTINVDTAGELAATKALGGQVPEVLAAARKDALDAQQGLENSRQILTLASDPQIISGFAAGQQLGLASLGAKMGFIGPEAAAKSQALLAAQARQTLAASTLLKGAISDKEKPFLEQASSGSFAFTPEAIQHLAKLSYAVNHNKLLNARDQWQGAASVKGAEAGAQMYPFPAVQHEIPNGADYTELPGGRLQYNGGLLAPAPAQVGAKPISAMTDAEKAAEIDALKRRLGIIQ